MERTEYGSINGTINMMKTMFEAISSRMNLTLNYDITIAEQYIGNNSHTMVAMGQEKVDLWFIL